VPFTKQTILTLSVELC